tara:strand:+ start:912 stop:1445 length:534 start_codon:yes stop_codon:yes gene_type:complete
MHIYQSEDIEKNVMDHLGIDEDGSIVDGDGDVEMGTENDSEAEGRGRRGCESISSRGRGRKNGRNIMNMVVNDMKSNLNTTEEQLREQRELLEAQGRYGMGKRSKDHHGEREEEDDDDEEEEDEDMSELRNMGFTDKKACRRALLLSEGNFQYPIEQFFDSEDNNAMKVKLDSITIR